MGSLTDRKPKPLVDVAGQPLLARCFETLRQVGVTEFVVVVGYRMDAVVGHFGDDYEGVPITYVHQRQQEGLAHAVLCAEATISDDFVVLNGDNVLEVNVAEAVTRQQRSTVDAVLLADEVADDEARTTGVLETASNGTVTSVVEKPDDPPSNLVTTGCYVLPEEVFHACHLVRPSPRGEYEFSDAIDLLASAGASVETVMLDGWRVNVNTPADVDRAERLLAGE
jgi:glucose-1-phosphate thymidylyltransferase